MASRLNAFSQIHSFYIYAVYGVWIRGVWFCRLFEFAILFAYTACEQHAYGTYRYRICVRSYYLKIDVI